MQRVVETVDDAEVLSCDIELELTEGEVISLKKTYRAGLDLTLEA